MTHVRGLHEIGGLLSHHVMRNKAKPGKLATKLARLDHQRELLERQLAIWTEKQQTTKHRLTLVEKQIAGLGRLVRHLGEPRDSAKAFKGVMAPGEQADGGAAARRRQDMSLEY
jgi:hypothetical protein